MTKKILVIGIGSIGRRHIRNIKFLFPNSTISLLSKSSNGTYDEEKLVDNIYHKISDVLSLSFYAIFICGPASSHIQTSLDFLKKGNNIFIEKPLSDKLANCNKFLSYAKFSKNIIQIGYQFKFHPALIKLRNEIKARKYGNLVSSQIDCSSYLPKWREGRDYSKTVSASKQLGGGVTLELSHEIDYANWLFGPFDKVSAISKNTKSLKVNVDDISNINLIKKNFICSISLNFHSHFNKRFIIVNFQKASVLIDLIENKYELHEVKKKISSNIKYNYDQLFIDEIKFFFNCIKKSKNSNMSLYSSFDTMNINDKVNKSSSLKKIIDVI